MTAALPIVWIARHGETEWSLAGRHTGRTDLPLTAHGEECRAPARRRLAGHAFAAVWTSPLIRAARTCELAGFGGVARVDPDLAEWDYGDYEGRRTDRHPRRSAGLAHFSRRLSARRDAARRGRARRPRAEQVARRRWRCPGLFERAPPSRAGGALARARAGDGEVLRAARTASLSALGYEHDRTEPAIRLWNDADHDNRERR